MKRKTLSGIMLPLLLIGMLTLAFDIQLIDAEFVNREVGVNVGDWVEYKDIDFSWESNVPYNELESQFKSFIRMYEDAFLWQTKVLEISGTLVKFQWLWRFKNGTEYIVPTYWYGGMVNACFLDVATGAYTNMFFIASNLSVGHSIYTNYPDWIITKTSESMYLGVSRDVNLLLNKCGAYNYTIENRTVNVSFDFTMIWDKITGILLEWYGQLEYVVSNQTLRYDWILEITGTNRWGYKIWIVDDDGPADFSRIQDAIDAASPGDIIFVKAGTYYENIIIDKYISLIGEDRTKTIIDCNWLQEQNIPIVYVTASSVIISGFTIENSHLDSGIVLYNSWNNTILLNNILLTNGNGILLHNSSCNVISNNFISGNGGGIYSMDDSCNNRIIFNNITYNNVGIYFCSACLGFPYIKNVIIEKNYIAFNDRGVDLEQYVRDCIFVHNLVLNNNVGFLATHSTLLNNTIYHNNIINNSIQASCHWDGEQSMEIWDDGYPSGGNYWSDYTGADLYSGPYQNETGSDGIGDTPYIIDENNLDNYPLMEPWNEISGRLAILDPPNGSTLTGPVNITFTIENTGDDIEFLQGDSSNRIDLEIEYRSTGGEIYAWGIMFWSTSHHGLTLGSGEKCQKTLFYNPSEYEGSVPPDFVGEAPYGEATIRLVHWKQMDEGYGYGEFGITEINVTFLRLGFHDVAVVSVVPSSTEAYIGQVVNITVTLQNQGNFTETFNVTCKYELEGTEHVIGNMTVNNLAPQANTSIVFTWRTTDVTVHTLKAEVQPLTDEADIDDNNMTSSVTVKVKMLGDVNNDDTVNILDCLIASSAFGSYPDHPRWNIQADINQDNKVNILDIILIAKNFGKTYP